MSVGIGVAVPVALHRGGACGRQPLRRPATAAGVHRLVQHLSEAGVLVVGGHPAGFGVGKAEHLGQHRPRRDVRQDVDCLGGAIKAVEVFRRR